MDNDVWYQYTAPADCTLTVDVADLDPYDMILAVHSGPDCRNLTEVACGDDPEPIHVELHAVAGTTYWLQLGDWGTAPGGGATQLNVDCVATGACCFPDGTCADVNPNVCLERGGTSQGEFSVCADASCPRDCVTCGANSKPEGERDCGIPVDTVNGGCNTDPSLFTPIACGESFCGTAGETISVRDTDWYQVELTEPTRITWTVTPEFDAQVGFVEMTRPGSGNCADATGFLDPFELPALCTTSSVSKCLPRGIHWLFVAPQFGSILPCGVEYEASLGCEPCQLGACCLDGTCIGTMERAPCAEAGGTWYADRNCDTFTCTQACCHQDGTCTEEAPSTCQLNGGAPQGSGSTCATATVPTPRRPNATPYPDCGPRANPVPRASARRRYYARTTRYTGSSPTRRSTSGHWVFRMPSGSAATRSASSVSRRSPARYAICTGGGSVSMRCN